MDEINECAIVQDFLLDVMDRVPDELIEGVRAAQRTTLNLESQLAHALTMNKRAAASLERLAQELSYLKIAVGHLSDTAIKLTIARPLVRKLRSQLEKQDEQEG